MPPVRPGASCRVSDDGTLRSLPGVHAAGEVGDVVTQAGAARRWHAPTGRPRGTPRASGPADRARRPAPGGRRGGCGRRPRCARRPIRRARGRPGRPSRRTWDRSRRRRSRWGRASLSAVLRREMGCDCDQMSSQDHSAWLLWTICRPFLDHVEATPAAPGSGGGVMSVRARDSISLPFASSTPSIARTKLAGFLTINRAPAAVIDDALIVISEMIANAVSHGVPTSRARSRSPGPSTATSSSSASTTPARAARSSRSTSTRTPSADAASRSSTVSPTAGGST